MPTQQKKISELGFTVIELLVVIQILAIIVVTVSAVFSNILHTRTRAQFNNLTRTSGNLVIESMVRDIKYSYGLNAEQSTIITDSCNDNPCAAGLVPVCQLSKIGIQTASAKASSYELSATTKQIVQTEYNQGTGEISSKIISPSTLKAEALQFTISPPLCLNESLQTFTSPENQDNLTIQILLTLQSPFYEKDKAQAYKQAEITLQSSATLRSYQRLQ